MSVHYSLHHIISSLTYKRDPLALFRLYRGTDWKSLITYENSSSPQSTVLWKSTTTKLVLNGWNINQFARLKTPHNATVHSIVLEGALYSKYYNEKDDKKELLSVHMYHILPPNYTCNLLSVLKSASLHLIQLDL